MFLLELMLHIMLQSTKANLQVISNVFEVQWIFLMNMWLVYPFIKAIYFNESLQGLKLIWDTNSAVFLRPVSAWSQLSVSWLVILFSDLLHVPWSGCDPGMLFQGVP